MRLGQRGRFFVRAFLLVAAFDAETVARAAGASVTLDRRALAGRISLAGAAGFGWERAR